MNRAAKTKEGGLTGLLLSSVDAAAHAILLFDRHERLLYWNKAVASLIPCVADEFSVGMDLVDVLRRLARHDCFIEAVGRGEAWVREQLSRTGGTTTHRLRDGRYLSASWSRGDGGRMLILAEVPQEAAAAEMERRAEHLRDVDEGLADWVWETDANLRLTYASEGLCGLFGLSGDELVGMGSAFFGRHLVIDDHVWTRYLAKLRKREPFRDLIVRLRGQCGAERRFRVNGAPHFAADGAFLGYRGTGSDLVHEAPPPRPAELGEQRQGRFDAVFHNAVAPVALIRRDGSLVQTNPAFVELFRFEGQEWQTLTLADLAEQREQVSAAVAALFGGSADHDRRPLVWNRNDGSSFWGELSLSTPVGEPDFGVVMLSDIDARRRAEDQAALFHGLFQASAEAVAVTALPGQPLYVNGAWRRLFGDIPQEVRRLFAPDGKVALEREVLPALRRGEAWEGVLTARRPDGAPFPVWLRAAPLPGPGGRVERVALFMRDHSVQQRLLDETAKAKEAVEQANTAKTRFLAAASHDLRQPLQALNMFVAVLGARDHTPQNAQLVARIGDSVAALEGLLNSLLDISKLEAGLVTPVEETFALGPLLQRLAADFQPACAEAGLVFRMVPSKVVVRSDPALLERMLRQLLTNAVRYTEQGKVLLGVRRHGDRLRIEVCDSGIGIPRSQLPLIFREFHQIGNPARDRRQGLGLGLAVVERLGRLLNHAVSVDSTPGKGSIFAVDVPLVEIDHSPMRSPRQLSLGIRDQGNCILVIDDEPDVLESMRMLLESWGHTVITAADCEQALQELSHGQAPDLVLADYRLQKGHTGGQAIARIRVRLKAPVPAIIVTGDTAPERLRQALASGHGLLHKPVQPAALKKAIADALSRRQRPVGRSARTKAAALANIA